MRTSIMFDIIEQLLDRQQEGILDLKDVVHHSDSICQVPTIRCRERLAEAGIWPAVGAVGSS